MAARDFLIFDADLNKLLDWKRGLSTDMLNGSGDVSPSDFGDLEAPDGGNAFGNELLGVDDIRSMDPDAFEALCALLWSKRGYPRTIKTPRSGDGGVDVVAIRGAEGVVILTQRHTGNVDSSIFCRQCGAQPHERGSDCEPCAATTMPTPISLMSPDVPFSRTGRWQTTWLALTMLALVHTGPVRATEIEYGSPDQSVWTTKLNERGEPDNPLLSVANALFANANIPWRGKTYPAARLFKYLQDGTTQFSMLVKAPSLQACCLWSKKPITVAEIRVYHLGNTASVKMLEELVGKHVITIRGYSYGGLRSFISDEKNRIQSSESPSHAAAFRMLTSGRADYLIDYAGPAAEVLASETVPGIRSDLLLRQDVHLVLSKSYPDADKVMQRLEIAAASLDIPAMLKTHGK